MDTQETEALVVEITMIIIVIEVTPEVEVGVILEVIVVLLKDKVVENILQLEIGLVFNKDYF